MSSFQTPPSADLAGATDRQLQAFLEADSDATADNTFATLMHEATSIIARRARRKYRTAEDPDAEELISEVRVRVAARLIGLRAEWQAKNSVTVIADFDRYMSGVTATTWTDLLRARHPARASLLNRLRYLLEDRTNQSGFALWDDLTGERCCGFAAWRDREIAVTPRLQWLLADPAAAIFDALGGRGPTALSPLAETVAGVLSWLGGPIALRELLEVLTVWFGTTRRCESIDADGAEAEPADPGPTPHDQARWKEYLAWLWSEVRGLSLRQRTAYLLHSAVPHEGELLGLTSVRQMALVLQLPPERMAELWNDIPLDDRTIAALLGASCQQVINLRKVARLRLGRAWQQWIRH